MPTLTKLRSLLSISLPFRTSTVLRLRHYCLPLLSSSAAAASSHGRLQSSFFLSKLAFPFTSVNQTHTQAIVEEGSAKDVRSFSGFEASHHWPEWSSLAELLLSKDYSSGCVVSGNDDDSFSVEEIPEDFLKAAKACLCFARARPDILRLLTKKHLETLVMNGSPTLFRRGEDSACRMTSLLTSEAVGTEKAQTVDIMRYLLSYIYDSLSSSDEIHMKYDQPIEKSVRKLLVELFNLSGTVWKQRTTDEILIDPGSRNETISLPLGQNIEMKSGDWICPKCNFHNYGGITSCVRCDCKRPADNPLNPTPSTTVGLNASSSTELSGRDTSFPEGYGSKVNNHYSNNAALPRQAFSQGNSAQHPTNYMDRNWESWNRTQADGQRLNENNTVPVPSTLPPIDVGYNCSSSNYGKSSESTHLPGNSWGHGDTEHRGFTGSSSRAPSNFCTSSIGYTSNSTQPSNLTWRGSIASYDGFSANSSQPPRNPLQTPGNSWNVSSGDAVNSTQQSSSLYSNRSAPYGGYSSNPSHAHDPWKNHDAPNSGNLIPPSINTWSAHPQHSSLPPSGTNLWAKSNTSYNAAAVDSSQPPGSNYLNSFNISPAGYSVESIQRGGNNLFNGSGTPIGGSTANATQMHSESWNNYDNAAADHTPGSWNNHNSCIGASTNSLNYNKGYSPNATQQCTKTWNSNGTSRGAFETPFQSSNNACSDTRASKSSDFAKTNYGLSMHSESCNVQDGGRIGYSGKSLEGSCVKEPDPLDMSEEAKAERWFRRVAQIKDISELSQIPDEDFPQIMPMRKGVNRFVVSKRKTPLERRLASQQYRRNLPVASSETEELLPGENKS